MFVGLFAFARLLAVVAGAPQPLVAQEQITVFAAASLKNALDDTNAAFTKATGVKVTASYAASSALAKQIEQGAPADIFISADLDWMDYLAANASSSSRTPASNLLGNKLVLIAPADSKIATVDDRPRLRHRQARRRRPHRGRRRQRGAGRTIRQGGAREARRLGGAEPKLAQAENVRATLAFVARGETPLGIVYETDAKVEPKVKIVGVFPDGSLSAGHLSGRGDRITTKPERRRNISASCASPAAKAIFEQYGFSFLIKPVS